MKPSTPSTSDGNATPCHLSLVKCKNLHYSSLRPNFVLGILRSDSSSTIKVSQSLLDSTGRHTSLVENLHHLACYPPTALRMSNFDSVASKSTFRLDRLTSEVVTHILGFQGMSLAILRLWTSGSHVIQQLLRRAAWHMKLEAPSAYEIYRFPQMLTSLTSLRSLSIVSPHYLIHRGLLRIQMVKVLLELSPTLEKLVLLFAASAGFFAPHHGLSTFSRATRTSRNDYELPHHEYLIFVDAETSFPRLQWLELDDNTAWLPAALPPTLTHLACQYGETGSIYINYEALLQSKLIYMRASSTEQFPLAFFQALPPSLEHLSLHVAGFRTTFEPDIEHLEALPRSLRTLELQTSDNWAPSPEQLMALPPSLESIFKVSNKHSTFLADLPTRLKELIIDTNGLPIPNTAEDVRRLSRDMRLLKIWLKDMHQLRPDDFPAASLTNLSLSTYDKSFENGLAPLLGPKSAWSSLSTLELFVQTLKTSEINSILPDTLTELDLKAHTFLDKQSTSITLPPHLTRLTVSELSHKDDIPMAFDRMPDSLTKLRLMLLVDVSSALLSLPLCLRSLRLNRLDWSLFDALDPDTIAKIQLLRKVGRLYDFGVEKDSSASALRSYQLFDLLPRSLKKLQLGEDCNAEKLDILAWQALPRGLQKLHVPTLNNVPLPSDLLDYLPLESICIEMLLAPVTVEDRHIKRLHPSLTRMALYPDTTWALSPAGIRSIPKDVSSEWISDPSVQESIKKLNLKRDQALADGDFQALKLLNDLPLKNLN